MKRHLTALAAALALAAIPLAGCGGSSIDLQKRAHAVDTCINQLAPGDLHAFRMQCECAVTYATSHGDSLMKLQTEMDHDTAITDTIAVQGGLLCADAH